MSDVRRVYSTDGGSLCPSCGKPTTACTCRRAPDAPLPARVVAKLRVEKSGRGGKTVTVIYDLPHNQGFLQALAGELKRACGTGGTAGDGRVEIQGDQRDRIRGLLSAKGWTVKG